MRVEYMIVRTSLLKDMDGLSESERGRLFTALLEYAASGEKKEPRGTERVLFRAIADSIVQDSEKSVKDESPIYIYSSKDLRSQKDFKNDSSKLRCSIEETFDRFWNSYPVHTDMKSCKELWTELNPDEELVEKILSSIERQKESRQWRTGYIPNPSKWLKRELWNDELRPDPEAIKRKSRLGYEDTPIPQESFDAMTVNLDEWEDGLDGK